jgi:uncharacterized protein (TIGR03382 family)
VFWTLGRQIDTELVNKPEGMQIDPRTGKISWTPSAEQVGDHRVTLRADNEVGSSPQDFVITVRDGGVAGPIDEGPGGQLVSGGCACAGADGVALVTMAGGVVMIWQLRRRRSRSGVE